jgi:hypothetical protein
MPDDDDNDGDYCPVGPAWSGRHVFTQKEIRHLKSEVTACDSAVETWDKISKL